MWHRWAGVVRRHPIIVSVVSLACLVPLIIPAFSLELGQEDVGATNPATTERKAYDLITAGFGVGLQRPAPGRLASSNPAATPSAEYTKKYNKATSLQKQLDQDQKQLPKQQKQLEQQQKQLEAQQATLDPAGQRAEGPAGLTDRAGRPAQGRSRRRWSSRARSCSSRRRGSRPSSASSRQQQATLRKKARGAGRPDQAAGDEAGSPRDPRAGPPASGSQHAQGHPQRLARLHRRLDRVLAREAEVRQELAPLKRQAEQLAAQARRAPAQAAALQRQADQLQAKADELNRQKAALEAQAAVSPASGRRAPGAGEQAAAAGRRARRPRATSSRPRPTSSSSSRSRPSSSSRQALKLQDQLTDMVTAAGGDARGHRPARGQPAERADWRPRASSRSPHRRSTRRATSSCCRRFPRPHRRPTRPPTWSRGSAATCSRRST